ncbi:receptor-like protein 9DC3 [Dioscorea cayenensis subsp. rotundata]|uniref:Receptor-like protein 9DC3 n=1 Tax=Dioscorea cayennensis subsp. rotundata TaxID=55577 RepID=A0AB40AX51_DIOCR|nr:receptor-like protein 9DC3 [Dioscorea cayenensis subsp. rotundata]
MDISLLRKLVSLDLSWSGWNTESPPLELRELIGGFSNLIELYLDGVNVSANGTEWCSVISESVPKLEALSLVGCSLTGPIDSSLSKLRNLSLLRLDDNDLSSEVPEFFEDFYSLNVLTLFNCKLQGFFPKSVFQLKNLKYIDISHNDELSGYLPDFLKDSTLESLIISSTNFSGSLPDSLGNLESLIDLDLSGCHFSGSIPWSFRNLSQLVYLDLSYNNLTGEIPVVLGGIWISEILLSNNNLTGSIPESFSQLNQLVTLDLQKNFLSGPIPASLFTLPALQELQLSENEFSGQLEEFSNASSVLQVVDLGNNNLLGEIPKSMFDLLGLQFLELSSNNFTGTIELDLFHNLQNLKYLDLSNNNLSVSDGTGDSSLLFPSLAELMLESCNLVTIPAFLKHKNNMKCLSLSNNKIGGTIPEWIWSIGDICYLNLSIKLIYILLTGEVPSSICQATNLRILDLSYNNLNGSIPACLMESLTELLVLRARVALKGVKRDLVNTMTIFTAIDLSNNQFEGPLPEAIGNLKALISLNMSGNDFNGRIPSVFENLAEMQSLDLSGNQLSGQIPNSLTSLTFLSFLNLSNNNLVGKIPYGNQFSTFSSYSFEGNPGLCRDQLSRQCVNSSVEPSSNFNNAYPGLDIDVIWIWIFTGLGFIVGFASTRLGLGACNVEISRLLSRPCSEDRARNNTFWTDRRVKTQLSPEPQNSGHHGSAARPMEIPPHRRRGSWAPPTAGSHKTPLHHHPGS